MKNFLQVFDVNRFMSEEIFGHFLEEGGWKELLMCREIANMTIFNFSGYFISFFPFLAGKMAVVLKAREEISRWIKTRIKTKFIVYSNCLIKFKDVIYTATTTIYFLFVYILFIVFILFFFIKFIRVALVNQIT